MKELEKQGFLNKKHYAIVEGIGNKEKPGQVQLRVSGVHPSSKTKLPTEDLPWQKVVKTTGSGAGIGDSVNLTVGQWVEVEAATPGSSSWKVIRNVPALGSGEKGDNAYGQVAEGEDDKLEDESEPKMSLGDIKKLAGTAFALLNSNLLTHFTDTINPGSPIPPGDTSPPIPKPNFNITTPDVDWTNNSDKEVSKDGRNIGNLRDLIQVDGHRADDDVLIELLDDNGHPGDVIGYDFDSSEIYITLLDDAIIVPRMVLKPNDPTRVVTLRYKATEIANPANTSEGSIMFDIVFNPTIVLSVQTQNVYSTAVGDSAKDITIKEDPNTADKAAPGMCKVWQSPDGLITERKDYTKGNVSWDTSVMTEKGNAESASRIHLGPTGICTMKSSSDMVMISKKNLQMYIENEVEQVIKTMYTLNCPTTKIVGDVRIEGDLYIVKGGKTVKITSGTVTADVDVVASSRAVSLEGHKHQQPHANSYETADEPTKKPT
jgi:hypothetical protein